MSIDDAIALQRCKEHVSLGINTEVAPQIVERLYVSGNVSQHGT